MNKICKGLMSIALAATVCFSSGVSAFAAENTTEPETQTSVTTYKHMATLYEPEARAELPQNTWQKFLGNVYNSAMPTVVTAGKTTMMSLTDLKEVVQSKSTSTSGAEGSFSSTMTTTVCGSMYSIFNEKSQTWETPKYIAPSSADWLVEGIILQSDGKDIYALCMEFKNDDMSGGDLFGSIFSGQLPQNQIVIHKYSPETASFSVFKIIEAKEGYTKLNPQLVFESDAVVATWCEMKNKSILEMMSGSVDFAFGYARYKDNTWSEPKTFADMQISGKDVENTLIGCPYTAGTIEGKLAVAYVDEYGENNEKHILFKNEYGTLLLGRAGVPELIISASPSKDNGFYYIEEGNLYYVSREVTDGQKKLVHKELAKNLPDAVEFTVSENNELYYRVKADTGSLYVRTYDEEQGKFIADRVLRDGGTPIENISVANYKDKTMVVILSDDSELLNDSLSEDDKEHCGFGIEYMLFNKVKTGEIDGSDTPTTTPSTSTDKTDEEKPSATTPTTTPSDKTDNSDDIDTTNKNPVITDGEDVDNPTDTPDTGASKVAVAAVVVFALAGAVMLVLKKKKD